MDEREAVIRRWFDMWLSARGEGIDEIFTDDAVYIESWGPEYRGAAKIAHWFDEWQTRGKVLRWDIRGFLHDGGRTAVEWYFECSMGGGAPDGFDGISVVRWSADGRISRLQEFACKAERYDPYEHGDPPRFRE